MLLDVLLPDLDGYDVCRQITGLSSVPVLLITGLSVDRRVRADAARAGAAGVLGKPVSGRELLRSVRAALGTPDLPA